ncbi:hypothetical protein F383_10516 [Gossypium arboreum]|uniref:Uncharacterized protein n=1 Tax=Gossypium arboreum TaxID=29729 RepID=A0A0B0PGZ7_GOSAR|nr:hypothetical protein F383_10516 [Gossypium arboreum]
MRVGEATVNRGSGSGTTA